eukprot:gene20338-27100_t
MSTVDNSAIPADAKFRKIIIPSVDTVRYTFLLDLAIKTCVPALKYLFNLPSAEYVPPNIVGFSARTTANMNQWLIDLGKSVLVQKYLFNLPTEEYVPPNIIGFSARTTANMTQYLIDAKLDRRRKGVFGPAPGKKAIIFVDDLNMPQLETYGAQPPIELLRQYMDHGGWYDRANTFRRMDDCIFVAAMGPPGGGRNHITPRYGRHFNLISIVDFDHTTLKRIFTNILDWALTSRQYASNIKELREPYALNSKELREPVIGATLDVYNRQYASNIKELREPMIDATLDVNKQVMSQLLPTQGEEESPLHALFITMNTDTTITNTNTTNNNNIKNKNNNNYTIWM